MYMYIYIYIHIRLYTRTVTKNNPPEKSGSLPRFHPYTGPVYKQVPVVEGGQCPLFAVEKKLSSYRRLLGDTT